jgi:hypothetical protein
MESKADIQTHFEPIIRPYTDPSLGYCSYIYSSRHAKGTDEKVPESMLWRTDVF